MELTEETKQELAQEIINDAQRITETVNLSNSYNPNVRYNLDLKTVEHLVYITEQIRLKLRMLGGPRIY